MMKVQYADDTTCVFKLCPFRQKCNCTFEYFFQSFWFETNVYKSKAMWLGQMRNSAEKPLDVEWPTDPIKALGVYFSMMSMQLKITNFNPKIKQIKTLFNIWKMRNLDLTLAGKILLIKTFPLSKLIYLASVTHVPENIIDQIDKIILNFLLFVCLFVYHARPKWDVGKRAHEHPSNRLEHKWPLATNTNRVLRPWEKP